MDGPTSSTVASTVSFIAESLSPDITRTMNPSTGAVTPPPRTRDLNVYVGVNPTMSSIRAMVSNMLGTPRSFDGASTPSTIGVFHSSNVGATFTSTVNPSVPQSMGAQLVIGIGSLFSSQTSLPQPTPFPGSFSMWSRPHIGNSPLQQQSSLVQNPIANSQFTPSSLGMFHPGSGGFPPLPSSNPNTNPTLGNSTSFPFGWNWNSTAPYGQQNVGLAYSGSSSHLLGNNPLLGNIGGTPPFGQQSSGSQAIPIPQQNVGFNPYSAQQLWGTLLSSQPPLGPTQSSCNIQQMGGINVPHNPSANLGQTPQQKHQHPLNMGPYIPNVPYQQPIVGMGNVLPTATPQGGSNYQPGWTHPMGTYAPRGPQNFGNVPLDGGFNPFQQGGYCMPYTN